ncbi:hypothetical protein HC081234_18130 [Helicobacter cinaedi]|nr:hypothetical protein HC081234_18130 [Helicobacter cinaedi]
MLCLRALEKTDINQGESRIRLTRPLEQVALWLNLSYT